MRGDRHAPTTVYRAYGASDELLYVGITVNVKARMRGHRRHSAWWKHHVRIETKLMPSRRLAELSESWIMITELPIYNVQAEKRHPA